MALQEETGLMQTRTGTDPNSPGKRRARLASAIAGGSGVSLNATAASRFEYQAHSDPPRQKSKD